MRTVSWFGIFGVTTWILGLFGALTLFGALFSNQHWALDFGGIFFLFGFWLLIIAAGLAVLSRKMWSAFSFALLAALGALGVLDLAPDTSNALLSHPQGLRVYQHNVRNESRANDSILEAIVASDAHLVVLLEATRRHFDQVLYPLEARYPYRFTDPPEKSSRTRIQVYSTFPIEEIVHKRTQNGAAIFMGRFQHNFNDVTLVVLHFARPWPFDAPDRQMVQVKEVITELNALEGPIVVMGDFNSPPWGRVIKHLSSSLGVQVVRTGVTATWPGVLGSQHRTINVPTWIGIPIDLVLTRGNLAVDDWQVGPTLGSDHRSVTFTVQ